MCISWARKRRVMAYKQYTYSNAQAQLSVPRMSSTEAKRPGIMFGRTRSDAMQSLEATEGPIGRSLAAEETEGHDAGEEIEADPKPKFQANLVCGIFDERPFFPSVLFLSTALGAFVMLTEQRSILIDMSGSAWFFTLFFQRLVCGDTQLLDVLPSFRSRTDGPSEIC